MFGVETYGSNEQEPWIKIRPHFYWSWWKPKVYGSISGWMPISCNFFQDRRHSLCPSNFQETVPVGRPSASRTRSRIKCNTCFKAKPFAFLKIKGINNSLYLSLSLSFSWCECWHYDAASQPAHWPNPKNKRLTHIVIVPTKLTKRAQICQQRMKHKVVLIQFVQIEVRAPVFLQLL